MTTRLLTLRDVMRMTALSRSAVYALRRQPALDSLNKDHLHS